MARLRTAFFAGIGAILMIAILPNTSWIVQNDLDLVVNQFPPDGLMLERGNIFSPGTWFVNSLEAASPDSEFALATMEANGILNPGRGRPQPQRLIDYCKTHPADPVGWATLVRLLSIRTPMSQQNQFPKEKDTQRYRPETLESMTIFLAACDAGAEADPDNAYFPMMKATMLPIQGDLNGARKAVGQAAACHTFEDYTWEEPSQIVKAMREVHGNRGAAAEIGAYGGVLFGHVTRIRKQLPELVDSPETQRNVIKCTALMARDTDSLITMAVARATYIRAIFSPAADNLPGKAPTSADIEKKISTLDPTTAAVAGPLARPFDLLKKSYSNLPYSEDAQQQYRDNAYVRPEGPLLTFFLLLALLPGASMILAMNALKRRISPLLRLGDSARNFLAAAAATVGVAGLAFLLGHLVLGGLGLRGLGEIGGVLFLGALVFMPASNLRFLMIAAPVSVLAGCVCLAQAAKELRSDQVLRAMMINMRTEATDARRAMGLPPTIHKR